MYKLFRIYHKPKNYEPDSINLLYLVASFLVYHGDRMDGAEAVEDV